MRFIFTHELSLRGWINLNVITLSNFENTLWWHRHLACATIGGYMGATLFFLNVMTLGSIL